MIDYIVAGVGGIEGVELVARIGTGFFFAASGYHKLFNKSRHASLVETLTELHIPLVRVNAWFVPIVELLAGLALIVGLLTVPAALGLAVICLVACMTDGPRRVRDMAPIDIADKADDWLYLPEVLYLILLGYIIANGPGAMSADWLLATYLLG